MVGNRRPQPTRIDRFSRAMLGSTSERIVRDASVPVLIVRS
jgi:nucleotide-binding universal stress UspA family protein